MEVNSSGKTSRRIFIASSSEGRRYAEAVFSEVERFAEPTLWDQDVFLPSASSLGSLEALLDGVDYGVVVLSPDDIRTMRDATSWVPRDNVIFELGLLIGRLGARKVFMLTDAEGRATLPRDLDGITYLVYQDRQDQNALAAVRTATRQIKKAIDSSPVAPGPSSFPAWQRVQHRHETGTDLRSMVEQCQRYIFISGLSLYYVVRYCHLQISHALERGAAVQIMLPSPAALESGLYDAFKPSAAAENEISRARWADYCASLEEKLQRRIALHTTDLLLTHSIGIYDERMFVNPFCVGCESGDAPSIEVPIGTPAYETYLTDTIGHIEASTLLFGSGGTTALQSLARSGLPAAPA